MCSSPYMSFMNGVGWEGIRRIGESLLLNFDAHPLASVDFDSKSRQRDGLNRCLEKFSQPICGKIEDGVPRSILLQQWAHLSDRLAQPFFYFDFTDFFRLFRDPRAAHGEIAAIGKEMSAWYESRVPPSWINSGPVGPGVLSILFEQGWIERLKFRVWNDIVENLQTGVTLALFCIEADFGRYRLIL